MNNAAVVALDPGTGEIKAMVGSVDYWDERIDGSFNVAVDGQRQPGSSFKPFTYLTALSQGYSAARSPGRRRRCRRRDRHRICASELRS